MPFYPFEVTTTHVVYALLGGFIVLFGMFSLLLRERLYVGEAIWAFLFGVIVGPYCANVFDPRSWGGNSDETTNVLTLEFTRVVLAIGVFAIGVELPKAYIKKHWKSLFYLLVPVMTWGWFVSAGLIYALIPGLNFLSSLAVAACLTPTDPILAAAVVGGKWADKHVPAHIRHLLAAESGCNDGAAFPFLFIALYLIIDRDVSTAVKDWFLILWLYQVLLGAIIGCLLGYGFRHLMKFCQRHNLIDRHSYVAQYISLAILTIGVCTLLGSDDLLAAFFCGTAFAWDGFFNKQTEESVFSSVIDILFNVATFIFVGAWMPFNKFQDPHLTLAVWRLIVIAILVLLLRRLPIIIALYKWIPDIKTFREAIFSGHFGPIGVGAVFISTLAIQVLHHAQEKALADGHETDPDHLTQTELLMETMQPIVAFMVLCSITIHGLSIPSFSLGRRVHSVSRTWSRRDTITSGTGARTPEWANQARLVSRREDIVINRDHDSADVDLEKGDGDYDVEQEKVARSGSSEVSDETKMNLSDTLVRPHVTESVEKDFVDSPVDLQDKAAATRPEPLSKSKQDSRDQVPPDGTETLAEWKEGHHRVIERRLGPGLDVEVLVINENPAASDAFQPVQRWRGKMHEWEKEAEGVGHAIRKEIETLGRMAVGGSSSSMHDDEDRKSAQTKGRDQVREPDQAVADDDDDEGWASEGSNGGAEAEASGAGKKGSKTRSSKAAAAHLHTHPVHAHKSRRRTSFRRGSISQSHGIAGGAEAAEEPRGRDGRPTSSGSSVSFATGPQIGARPGNGSSSRLGTGSSSGSAPGGYASAARASRPGTGDSLRNNRVESIRAFHSRPPTRESSPSRSVRFVDEEGRAGARGSSGSGPIVGQIVDSPVVEEPGSIPSSRAPSPPPVGEER